MKVQRLRLRYAVSEEASAKSHRELLNDWGEAAKAAGLPVAYSEGKRPAPQLSVAALLPQGVTSDAEIMDVYLEERVDPCEALANLKPRAPAGVLLRAVEEVGVSSPSVQSLLRWAEYEVEVPSDGVSVEAVQAKFVEFLATDTWPAEYRRETRAREYDLRPLVLGLAIAGERNGCIVLRMALRAEQDNSARADQVLIALGLPGARRIHRRSLHLDRVPAAVLNYRRDSYIE